MSDNLIIKIDGDAANLEKELNNAAGTGVRAFKRFGDGTNEQLDRMQDLVDDVRMKLVEMGEDGQEAMEDFGDAGERALDTVKKEAKTTGKSAGDSMEDAAKRSENAWNKVKGVLKAIAGAAVVRQIVNIGKEAVGLASDLDEVQNVIDVTFGEGNQKIENFAQTAAKQFGISELSAKRMTGTMGAMLKSLNIKNVDDMSTSLVGLAADMGSFYNLEAEEAFAKLRSGISGETEPLKQLGINMSAANLEAFALSKGMKKAYKDMDAAEQATLRYEYIMKATADAQGDFSRTSGSMANQLKIAKLNVENMKASLGKALLPTATAAVHAMNNFVTNIQNGFPKIKEIVGDAVSNIGNKLNQLGVVDRAKKILTGVKNAINEGISFVLQIMQTVASSPVFQAIKDALADAFSGIMGLWDTLGELLSALEPIWEGLKASVGDFINAFLNAKLMFITIFHEAVTFVKSALEIIIGILTLDKEKIKNGFVGMKDSILNIGKALWKGLGSILGSLWNGIVAFLGTLKAKIKLFAEGFKLYEKAKEWLENLKNGIDEGWEKIKTWFETTKENALKKISEIDLKQTGLDILEKLKSGFTEKWSEVTTWLDEKKQYILDLFTGIDLKTIGIGIVNSLKQGFLDAWAGFLTMLEDKINGMLDVMPDKLKEWLGIERVSLIDKSPAQSAAADTGTKPNTHQRVLGIYETGTVTPEEALKAYEEMQAAADTFSDAADIVAGKKAPYAPYAGYMPFGDPREKKKNQDEPDPIVAETSATVSETAATVTEAAEAIEETSEPVLTAAEALEEARNELDDGVEFSLDDDSLSGIGEVIDDSDVIDNSAIQGQTDHLGNLVNAFEALFKDQTDEELKKLDGIGDDVADIKNGGSGTGSEYTLLDEYNELMGLWSNNKDANGEWIADWSEGGIGQTLADLIQGKMPGKYWGDLTEEDKRRMAGMTASDGYVKGQYETKFAPTEPVTIPADLEIVGIENSEGASEDVLDLDSLKEAVPEEAILSWQNLDAAFGSVMQTLNGGEGGLGLPAVLQSVSDLVGALPGQLDTLCGALTGSVPDAVGTALKFIGTVTPDENGEMQIGGGNTLMTSFGTVKVLFEDTNAAIEKFCKGLTDMIPPAVEFFKTPCGTASSLLSELYMWAFGAADQFFRLADGIDAAAAALKTFGGGSAPDGGGEGSGLFAAAHGGQVRGVGVVGEHGAEVISTSRNLNVFTNRALEIAQAKVADAMSKRSYASDARSPRLSKDDLLTAMQGGDSSINVTVEGSIFGEAWLQDYVVKTMTGKIRRELAMGR